MIKLKLLFIGIFTISSLNAQSDSKNFLSYEVSEPYQVIDAYNKMYFSYNENIISVKISGAKIIVQKIDGNSLKEVSRKEYTDFKPGFALEQVIEMNGHGYLFYSAWDRANTTEQLFARRIDFENGTIDSKDIDITKVKGKVLGGNGNKFTIVRSYDQSKILVRYKKYPEERSAAINKDNYGLMVLDNKLEQIWADEVKMPYTEKEMSLLDYTIDSEGFVYLLIDKKIDGNSNVEILIIKDGEVEKNKTEIAVENKTLVTYGFYEGANNKLLLSGYYRNSKTWGSGVDGVFNFELDNSGDILNRNMYEIPVEIMKQYVSPKSQEKIDKSEGKGNDLTMGSLRMRYLHVADDNSITIVGEVFYIVTTTTQNGTSTRYYYEDVLITKIDAKGELSWMKKLPKRQTGTNGCGIKYIRNNDNHYVIFIDNIKNLVPDINLEPETHRGGAGGFLMVNKIDDKTGDVVKASVFDLRDAKGHDLGQLSMDRIIDISENTFGVECYIGKKKDVTIKFSVD